jgi:hypothetical protein
MLSYWEFINENAIINRGDMDLTLSHVLDGKFEEKQPEIVNGHFSCNDLALTSLEGGPLKVDGIYDASDNKITNLIGGPDWVGFDFMLSNNMLTSLEGCPKEIGKNFYVEGNMLNDLKGGPEIVHGHYYCSVNQFTSLEGVAKHIGGKFICDEVFKHDNMPHYDPQIEIEFVKEGFYKEDYWSDLLKFCMDEKKDLSKVNWPEEFVKQHSDLFRSAKGVQRYKL